MLKVKRKDRNWGDHVDIVALSECYNVRALVFEVGRDGKPERVSLELGKECPQLPAVLLARQNRNHYNSAFDRDSHFQTPYSDYWCKANVPKLKDIRKKEFAKGPG